MSGLQLAFRRERDVARVVGLILDFELPAGLWLAQVDGDPASAPRRLPQRHDWAYVSGALPDLAVNSAILLMGMTGRPFLAGLNPTVGPVWYRPVMAARGGFEIYCGLI